jgi:hypothetical protein
MTLIKQHPIYKPRAVDMSRVFLAPGGHKPPEHWDHVPNCCAMELCSYLGGEPWTETPSRVAPFFVGMVRVLNDSMEPQPRQLLKPLCWPMVGTNDDPEAGWLTDMARCYWIAERMLSLWLPDYFNLHHSEDLAVRLLAMPTIRSPREAHICTEKLRALRVNAWARAHQLGAALDDALLLTKAMIFDKPYPEQHSFIGAQAARVLSLVISQDAWGEIVPLCEGLLQVNAA